MRWMTLFFSLFIFLNLMIFLESAVTKTHFSVLLRFFVTEKRQTIFFQNLSLKQGYKSSGRTVRPGPQKSWDVTARPSWNPEPGRSCTILFLSVFLKDFLKKIWTLLLTHFKLSIVLSKKWRNIDEIFAEYWQKTARPSRNFGPTGPAQFAKP